MAEPIEWDIDAGLPLYTRDFIKNRKDFVMGFKIKRELYSPEDVEIVMNFGQHFELVGDRLGSICSCEIGHSHPKMEELDG